MSHGANEPQLNISVAGNTIGVLLLSSTHHPSGVRQTQTGDWQINEVNIVVECSNRFSIPKLDF